MAQLKILILFFLGFGLPVMAQGNQIRCADLYVPGQNTLFEQGPLKAVLADRYRNALSEFEQEDPDLDHQNALETKLAFIEASRKNVLSAATGQGSLIEVLGRLSRGRQKKVIGFLKSIDLTDPHAQSYIKRWSARFFYLTQGLPIKTTDLLIKSADQKFEDQASYFAQRDILEHGMLKVLSNLQPQVSNSKSELRFRLFQIKASPIWNILQFPFSLPPARIQPLPGELIERALMNGFSSVRSDVDGFYKKQNGSMTYNNVIRPAWMLAATVITLAFLIPVIEQQERNFTQRYDIAVKGAGDRKVALMKIKISAHEDVVENFDKELTHQIFIKKLKAESLSEWSAAEVKSAALDAYQGEVSKAAFERQADHLSPNPSNIEIDGFVRSLDQVAFKLH